MMTDVVGLLKQQMLEADLRFVKKPILIGGMAMEYYGIRKSGADIDLVVCDEDYQALALKHPDKRKDIWGDLGVVIHPFEIWRCIALLDYDFYAKDAVDEESVLIASLERLLLMRVIAMDVPKYMKDLKLIKEYYYKTFRNPAYQEFADSHMTDYKGLDGIVWSGKYSKE